MAAIDFKHAVGRVFLDAGLTDEGKIIRKSKTYQNIAENANADDLYTALEALASLSKFSLMGVEKVETATVSN